MADFSQFINSAGFKELPENNKPEAIRRFYEASASQFEGQDAQDLLDRGESLSRIQEFKTQAQFGGELSRPAYTNLARIEAKKLNNIARFKQGAITFEEGLNNDVKLALDGIRANRKVYDDTTADRRRLAELYLLSGQSDQIDKEALTNVDKKRAQYDELLAKLGDKGVTSENIQQEVAALTGNFEGNFTTDLGGNVVAKPSVFYNDRDTIINLVNSSDINKLNKERFISEVDARREQFAKAQLDVLDDAVRDIVTSRNALGLISQEEFEELSRNGARNNMDGDTDIEKLENYVKKIRGSRKSTAVGNIAGNVSELNKASNAAIGGLLSLNPLRLIDSVDEANDEIQKTLLEGRQGMDTIVGFNEAINGSNDSLFYKTAKGIAGTTPSLALMLSTGGLTGGALRAGAARVGLGTTGQRIAFSAGLAVPGSALTFNDILVEAQNHQDPTVREKATRLAFTGAATEMAITTAFGSIPGFEGVEKVSGLPLGSLVKKLGGKKAVVDAFKGTVSRLNANGGVLIKGISGEIAEETLISTLNAYLVQSETNPDLTFGEFKDSLVTTAATSGVLSSAFNARGQIRATREFAKQQLEAANQVPDVNATDEQVRDSADAAQAALEEQNGAERTQREEAALRIGQFDQRVQRGDELNEQDIQLLQNAEQVLAGKADSLLPLETDLETSRGPAQEQDAQDADPEETTQESDPEETTPDVVPQGEVEPLVEADADPDTLPTRILGEGDSVFYDTEGQLTALGQDGQVFQVQDGDPLAELADQQLERVGELNGDTMATLDFSENAVTSDPVDQVVTPEKVVDDAPRVSETDSNIDNDLLQDVTPDVPREESTDSDLADPAPDRSVDDYRDDVFEVADEALERIDDVETRNNFNQAISNAQTKQELQDIEATLVQIAANGVDKEGVPISEPGAIEEISVSRFNEHANEDQLLEFFQRLADEDPEAIVTDIANRDGVSNFQTIDELLEGVDLKEDVDSDPDDDGDTDVDLDPDELPTIKMYDGFSAAFDPDLWINTAKTVWKVAKTLGQFSTRMIKMLGSGVAGVVRHLWNDLQKNKGEIKEANPTEVGSKLKDLKAGDTIKFEGREEKIESIGHTARGIFRQTGITTIKTKSGLELTGDVNGRVGDLFDQDSEAAHGAIVDEALAALGVDPTDNPNSKIKKPADLTRSQEKAIAKDPSGSQNTFLARALNVVALGSLTQIQRTLRSKFYGPAVSAWLWGKTSARPKGRVVAQQMRSFYGKHVTTDKDGNLEGVVPKEGGPQSLRPSDVIESLMEDPTSYKVSEQFQEFVAEWRGILNHTLKRMHAEGLEVDFLLDDSGQFDYSKLQDNNYYPRGRVAEPEGGQSQAGVGSRPRKKIRAQKSRQFAREEDGATDGNLTYLDDPFARIEEFLTDVNTRIADWRLATDPDLRENAKPLSKAFEVVEETVDQDGNPVVKTKVKADQSKLGDAKLNIGGNSFNFDNSSTRDINRVIENTGEIDPDSALGKIAKTLGVARAFQFVGDTSAFTVQLYYLSRRNPVRFAKTVKASLIAGLGIQKSVDRYYKDNKDVIAEAATHGMLIGSAFEDLSTIQNVDSTSSKISQTLKTVASPFTRVHQTAMNIGSMEIYKSLRHKGLNPDGSVNPKRMAEIARFADRVSGRESLARNGIGTTGRSLLSAASSAPSMYAAYINVMSDLASKNPAERQLAFKSHVRFLAGASTIFVGQALASMLLDDEDKRSFDDKLLDAASRLNPASSNFMRYEVPVGDRRTVISQGSFFRSALAASAKFTAAAVDMDGKGMINAYRQFLNTRKSPGLSTAIQLLTDEDYFGNEVTVAETLQEAFTPVALQAMAAEARKPIFSYVEDLTGAKLNSDASLVNESPVMTDTFRETVFGIAGFQNFTESSSRKFKRQRDGVSQELFGVDYEEATTAQKRATILEADKRDIKKPVFKDLQGGYRKFLDEQFEKSVNDVRLMRQLRENFSHRMVGTLAGIPRKNIKFRKNEPSVQMGTEEFETALNNYTSNLKSFINDNTDVTEKKLQKEARRLWGNELRALDYPVPRR